MPTETRQSRRAVSARRKKATLYGARWDMTELIEAEAMEQKASSAVGRRFPFNDCYLTFARGRRASEQGFADHTGAMVG